MKPFHQAACQTQNLKSHFVSNIIFILGKWWREESGATTMWKEREAVDRVQVSEDCYSKDKQGHQSKLKKRTMSGMKFCTSRHTYLCVHAHLRKYPHAVGLTDQCWLGWWGGFWSLHFNFSSHCALSQQHFHISASITAHGTTPPQTHKMPVKVILLDSHDNKQF